MMDDLRIGTSRTWAEINLENLANNFRILRARLNPNAKLLAVCKADAYGHGAISCAKKFQALGADYLGVATIAEGIELRENGIDLPILCLGQANTDLADLMSNYKITQAVGDFENGKKISDSLTGKNARVKIHVKIDSGMGRTGFYWPEPESEKIKVANEIKSLCQLPGLEAEGIFTHFADADSENFTRAQLARFTDAVKTLSSFGVNFEISHAAASVGVLKYPEAHLDMGRFGLVLYGYADTETGNKNSDLGLKPVMKVMSKITAVRKLPAGVTISYGRTFELKRDSFIAILPVGYADGMPRVLSNNFFVKVHEKLCPVLGRICMDMCMADVTDLILKDNIDVKAGDVAVILDEDLAVLAAKNAGTIIHEILCSPSKRVPRVFVD